MTPLPRYRNGDQLVELGDPRPGVGLRDDGLLINRRVAIKEQRGAGIVYLFR